MKIKFGILKMFVSFHEDSFIDYIIIYSDNLNVYLYLNTF